MQCADTTRGMLVNRGSSKDYGIAITDVLSGHDTFRRVTLDRILDGLILWEVDFDHMGNQSYLVHSVRGDRIHSCNQVVVFSCAA